MWAADAAAQTHTVSLVAAPFDKTMTLPDGTAVVVPMWGFALDANGNGTLDAGEQPTVPGPRIVVPPGTTALALHLRNLLPAPVSLVVPGLQFDASPVRNAGGRIVSMTHEAAAGGGSQVYRFTNLRPGTFLYQSGTHPAVQVQMGLYGAVTQNFADADAAAGLPAQAFAGVPYGRELVLLHSEIDIALHQAVANGVYGNVTLGGPTSTIDYAPSLYLINGDSYANDLATPPIAAGVAGQPTLIRLLNAGLKTHAPTLDNAVLALLAEDGNRYPFRRAQASILLPAGKTHDALWIPASAGTFTLYDHSLSLSAAGQGNAGMLAKLRVGAASADPSGTVSARDDAFTAVEDVPLVVAGAGVLANDTSAATAQLVTAPAWGSLALNAGGGFQYHPAPDFFGVDSFTYVAVAGANTSGPATVTIAVAAAPDSPVAIAQSAGVQAQASVPVRLGGTDPDGDTLTAYITDLPVSGTLSIVDPITNVVRLLGATDRRIVGPGGAITQAGTAIPGDTVRYTPEPGNGAIPPFSGSDGFSFVVADATRTSAAAQADVTVHALEVGEECPTCRNVAIRVVGSDGEQVGGYRWTVEEDRTFEVQPGVLDPNTLAVSFHRSYMPVVQSGDETSAPLLDATKRYFVSVLPKGGGYSNGGAAIGRNQVAVDVTVNRGPIPTAQIRVRVFHDNAPLNAMWDTTEGGLSGFAVTIEDAGGRYGMSAGQQMMDAFGNPIGTVYGPCPSETCTSLEVLRYGNGFVFSDADGWALIENLAPGKYGVKVVPPGGEAWQQTSTIEGTKAIDAWVKANEPPFFAEFGPPGPHADIGMVQRTRDTSVLGAGSGPFSTITGQVTNLHLSRPPSPEMFSGAPFDFTTVWVALNTGIGTAGTLLSAQPADSEGNFRIDGVPSGSYTLVVFDSALNIIVASKVLNVAAPTAVALGTVPVNHWFTRLYNYVFQDENENGFRDDGEPGLPEQAINIRWRDGSMYQSSATDGAGFVPFEEVFPFFSWLVAEVDYTRMRATGVTAVVDNGGNPAVNPDWPAQVGAGIDPRTLVPQPQSENGNAAFRTETGPVLTQAFQGFLGQSNVLLWGKAPYAAPGSVVTDVNRAPFDVFDPGDAASGDIDSNGNGVFDADQYHGGISGIVHYSTTRAENDPRWGGPEVWEPGIPGVRVQLWDVTRTKLLNEVTTDSWDESLPTGCQGPVFTFLGQAKDCYDGLRNFNQVRPGIFDGGYAFMTVLEPFVDANGAPVPIEDRVIEKPLPAGSYVVKVIVPRGYQIVKEEDKNVDFGDEFIPQQFLLTGYPLGDTGPADAPPQGRVNDALAAPFCAGIEHLVPPELALFPGVPTAYAGEERPLCDEKVVTLRDGQNAGVNFFLFTEAPVASHIVGFVLDDTANEFDPNSPQFGEKYAPPFLPIAIRDFNGREIGRTYTDAFGRYNMLVPSTYTANVPAPSGVSPSMLTACVNAATLANGAADPYFNRRYSQFCYTFQYMPGTTTYLDTPVLPTGAFTGADQFPVDAELPDRTPVIASVNGPALNIGPYVVDRGAGNAAARTIVITSAGNVQVPNPFYDGIGSAQPQLITRDYGFGTSALNGFVRLDGFAIPVASWSNTSITAVVPTGPAFRTGQLTVERCLTPKVGNGCAESKESVAGITLTIVTPAAHLARPPRVVNAGERIQAAIDAATAGDLVLVRPGTYEEMLVMSKPVRLQGWGAESTRVHVIPSPAERLQAWRNGLSALLAARPGYLLPDQVNILGPAPFVDEAIASAFGGEGAGVLVLGQNLPTNPAGQCLGGAAANEAYCLQNETLAAANAAWRPNARIDGFSIHGASNAAGVMVNAYARFLQVSNNRIFNNLGDVAGGIRIGHAGAQLPLADENAMNTDVVIRNNIVSENAGLSAEGGGGIVIGTGSDRYLVRDNYVVANFTAGQGAGIAHIGRSARGTIDGNAVVFNESFDQAQTVSGGGIFIGGRPALAGGLTPGSGSVEVKNNLIQGNQAAAGDGGGIALVGVNGSEPAVDRFRVDLFNNVIVNNEAALAGGGIALHDAASVRIVHNTIVHNDSLATAGAAFTSGPLTSVPQPAGIVSRGHSPALAAVLGAGFSSPLLVNSIVWENRSFYYGPLPGGVQIPGDPAPAPITYGLIRNAARPNWDLGVLGAPAGSQLNPQFSVLTSTAGYAASNTSVAPSFVAQYTNGARNQTIVRPETTTIQTPAAFDEGGNFIRPLFGPLTLVNPATGRLIGDYHVTAGVAGQWLSGVGGLFPTVASIPTSLRRDFDGDARVDPVFPRAFEPHRGADQVTVAPGPVQGAPGLVAAYAFDEVTGTVAFDASPSANHGVFSATNGPSRTSEGRFGGALIFDGIDDLVRVADSSSLDITRMTLSAWVKPSALTGWRSVLLKERPTTGLAYGLYANSNVNGPGATIRTATGTADQTATSAARLSVGEWHHVAGTYDGAVLQLYVDGALARSTAVTGNIAGSGRPLFIGGNEFWGEWFAGVIDEVRIYDRALTAAEIQADMSTPVLSDEMGPPVQNGAGLVAAYGFDELSGTVLFDASPAGNHGLISGATAPTRTADGRFGRALAFDGVDDLVRITDSASLDITRMTLSAWVNPSASGGWRSVVLKERPTTGLAYGLYANSDANGPEVSLRIAGATADQHATMPSSLPVGEWHYVAATYDGTALRLFVDGVEVSATPLSGNIATTARPLFIGGNEFWGEWFGGVIDELRVYNRALTAEEILVDMSTPVVVAP
jgi:FtsP/CotA-like multicopper oxidase with cupredoxin domain